MDILNPNAPALPHKEATHGQAAIDEAEKTLSDFKKLSKEIITEVTELHEAAKDLVKEVMYNCEQGQAKVNKAEWSDPEFSNCKSNLAQKQEKPWETLEAKATGLKSKMDGHYKLVLASKENMLRARGDSVTGGWLGSATPDQKLARKVYDNKLRHGFDEAAAAHAAVSAYPDGMVTHIPLLRKRAAQALAK